MKDYNHFELENSFDGDNREQTTAEHGFILISEYSRNNENLHDVIEEKDYPPANLIVPVNIPHKIHRPKKRRHIFKAIAAVACAFVLMLGSGIVGATFTESRMSATLADLEQQQAYTNAIMSNVVATVQNGSSVSFVNEINPSGGTMELTDLFVGANPAVVAISTQAQGRNAFGRQVTQPAAGSGFIVSEDGYIVTNYHVIQNAISISVLLYDGTSYPAFIVGGDARSDLAVLKIERQGLSYLGFADSDELMVGAQVAAIGNPLGEFANSMTVGVVSALDREINIDGITLTMLQTDAAVNSGNSGGPLLDMTGRVVGVVTAKSGGMNVEGLGFAIPSNVVQLITNNLIDDGFVRGRAVIGVQIGATTLNGEPRVYVDSTVSGGGADTAGVLAGDIIISANGMSVSTFEGLRSILDTLSPGDEMHLQILRDDALILFPITLNESMAN